MNELDDPSYPYLSSQIPYTVWVRVWVELKLTATEHRMTGCKNFHFSFGSIHANHRCFKILAAPNPAYQAVPFSFGSCIVTCFFAGSRCPSRPHLVDDRDDGSCTEARGESGLETGVDARDCDAGSKPLMDGGGDSCVGISLCRGHD